MQYVVNYFDDRGKWSYADANPPSLEHAKALAEGAVEQGTAARAEVRDESDNLVFCRPRAVSNA